MIMIRFGSAPGQWYANNLLHGSEVTCAYPQSIDTSHGVILRDRLGDNDSQGKWKTMTAKTSEEQGP